MFERGGEADHFFQTVRLHSFGPRCVFGSMRRNALGQVGFEIVPKFQVMRLAQSACDAPPQNPKLVPPGFLLMKLDALGKEAEHLFAAPSIERVAEARTEGVAGNLTEHPLMLGRTATP